MKKIWVTGANGQLGRSLRDLAATHPSDKFQFLFLDKSQLDITHPEAVDTFFIRNKADYIINCAAYTAVDLAETEVEEAFQLNADGVKYLADVCKEQNATFIHISTDYVFDGNSDQPYLPTDTPNPINVYGKSKLEGERLALETNPKSFVIRTSWVYSDYGKNFYTTMIRLMSERDEISVVSDQIGKPTHARDLAAYIYTLIISENTDFGIHHFSGSEQMSWYEFAKKIAAEKGFSTQIHPIPTSDYPTPAKRPMWSVLG